MASALMLTGKDMREIDRWMQRNARPLEMACWRARYGGGERGDVLCALSAYQNEDGGFGHALEADNWNPASTPAATLKAADILIEYADEPGARAMTDRALSYLAGPTAMRGGLWLFGAPGNERYPHAPWWSFDENKAPGAENIGISASVCAFILRAAPGGHDAYALALRTVPGLLERLDSGEDIGEMGVTGFLAMLDALDERGVAAVPGQADIRQALLARAHQSIMRDPAQWAGYTVRPSRYITGPDSPLLKGNEDIVACEMDYLITTRQREGVWGITWSWFDLQQNFEHAFALSENWWKASIALDHVRLLDAFGRVE